MLAVMRLKEDKPCIGDDMFQIGSKSAIPYSDWHVGLYTFVIMTP